MTDPAGSVEKLLAQWLIHSFGCSIHTSRRCNCGLAKELLAIEAAARPSALVAVCEKLYAIRLRRAHYVTPESFTDDLLDTLAGDLWPVMKALAAQPPAEPAVEP